eukprot:16452279-Heterocapsa_arctica.AAC.1
MTQVDLLIASKLKTLEDRLLEHIRLISARTSLIEANSTRPVKHETVHLKADHLAAPRVQKHPEASRKGSPPGASS